MKVSLKSIWVPQNKIIKKISTNNDKTKLEKFKGKENKKQNNLNELVTRFRLSKFNKKMKNTETIAKKTNKLIYCNSEFHVFMIIRQ